MLAIRDEYAPRFGRQVLTIWDGAFASEYVGEAWENPRGGYMVKLSAGRKVRVTCESPRDDANWQRVDHAICEAVNGALSA